MNQHDPPQRWEAGLWCGEVLALLPDFVDGDLPPETLARVHAHLAVCDWCTRFGGAYAATVSKLRGGEVPEGPSDLLNRLEREIGG